MWQAKITGNMFEVNNLLGALGISISEAADPENDIYGVILMPNLERLVSEGKDFHVRLGEAEISIEHP